MLSSIKTYHSQPQLIEKCTPYRAGVRLNFPLANIWNGVNATKSPMLGLLTSNSPQQFVNSYTILDAILKTDMVEFSQEQQLLRDSFRAW